MRDLRTLLQFEGLRLNSQLTYWLRVLGVEEDDTRLYRLYVYGFGVFWLVATWGWAVDTTFEMSRQMASAELAAWREMIPGLLFGVHLIVTGLLLRLNPARVTASDITWLATSPVSRRALILVRYMRFMVTLLPGILIAILLTMFLSWQQVHPDTVGMAGLQGGLLALPLLMLYTSVAWMLSLLRLTLPPARRQSLWLVPVVMLLLAQLLPDLMLLPGSLWSQTIRADLTASAALTVCVLAGAGLSVLLWVAGRFHMTDLIDESATFARLSRAGSLRDTTLSSRIERQASLSQRRVWLALPDSGNRNITLLYRALLARMRRAPMSLLTPLAQGLIGAGGIISLLQTAGTGSIQAWLLLVIMLSMYRPSDLIAEFAQDVGTPFLHSLLPVDNLRLCLLDCALPVFLTTVGGLVPLFILTAPETWLFAGLTVLLLVTLLTLTQAVASVRLVDAGIKRVPYDVAVLLCGVVLFAAVNLSGSLLMVVMVLATLNGLFAWLLHYSQ